MERGEGRGEVGGEGRVGRGSNGREEGRGGDGGWRGQRIGCVSSGIQGHYGLCYQT